MDRIGILNSEIERLLISDIRYLEVQARLLLMSSHN